MKQIVQQQRNGRLELLDVPAPVLQPGGVLVRTAFSLISAGTERSKVAVAQKSLLGKALARPDQVRQVLNAYRQLGLEATYQKVADRLEALEPLGYSSAGVVVAVGDKVSGLRPGDRLACAGGGYASHAEVIYVPQNLCAPVPEGVGLDAAAFGTLGAVALQGQAPRLIEVIRPEDAVQWALYYRPILDALVQAEVGWRVPVESPEIARRVIRVRCRRVARRRCPIYFLQPLTDCMLPLADCNLWMAAKPPR